MKFTLIKSTLNHQLITVKAIKAIKEAELVIIDPYTDSKILDIALTSAILYKKTKNEEISHILCKQNIPDVVVQLTEERSTTKKDELYSMNYFKKRGYETTIIPGISSINGITGKNHFPLTIRGRNESFWVYDCRSSTKDDPLPIRQIAVVAGSRATIVITNPNKRFSTAFALIAQYRNASTSVLLCTKDNTFISTTLSDLTVTLIEQLHKNCYMIVVNPDPIKENLAIQLSPIKETNNTLQSLLAV